MRAEDVRWRIAGVALFVLAGGAVRWRPSLPGVDADALATGLSLLGFCLAIAGVMLLVSGRRWLDRAAAANARPMPLVRSRVRRARR